MNRRTRNGLAWAAVLACIAWAVPAQAASFTYTVLSPNGQQAVATAVNSAGQVTGAGGGNPALSPFVWQNGTFTTVPTPKGVTSFSPGPINASGITAGSATQHQGNAFREAIYTFNSATGISTRQLLLPAHDILSVTGIDTAGDIVGSILTSLHPSRSFGVILSNGKLTKLHPFGSRSAAITAVNGAGEIAGAYVKGSTTYGFTQNGGVLTTIQAASSPSTAPLFVSNAGIVTGFYTQGSSTIGFVDNAGVITSYQDTASPQTKIIGVGPNGALYGDAIDTQGVQHGFVYVNGAFSHIAPPNMRNTATITGSDETTGTIVGYFTDTSV